jgi:hypothetical protein
MRKEDARPHSWMLWQTWSDEFVNEMIDLEGKASLSAAS